MAREEAARDTEKEKEKEKEEKEKVSAAQTSRAQERGEATAGGEVTNNGHLMTGEASLDGWRR